MKKNRLWPKNASGYIIEKMALNWPVSAIRSELRALHGVSVEARHLYAFSHAQKKKISAVRKKISTDIESHALASKLVRLEALNRALEDAQTPTLARYANRTGPLIGPNGAPVLDDKGAPVSQTVSVPIFETRPGIVPAIVREARAEVEGERALIDQRQQLVQVFLPTPASSADEYQQMCDEAARQDHNRQAIDVNHSNS